jgi:hypothetical protein
MDDDLLTLGQVLDELAFAREWQREQDDADQLDLEVAA